MMPCRSASTRHCGLTDRSKTSGLGVVRIPAWVWAADQALGRSPTERPPASVCEGHAPLNSGCHFTQWRRDSALDVRGG